MTFLMMSDDEAMSCDEVTRYDVDDDAVVVMVVSKTRTVVLEARLVAQVARLLLALVLRDVGVDVGVGVGVGFRIGVGVEVGVEVVSYSSVCYYILEVEAGQWL